MKSLMFLAAVLCTVCLGCGTTLKVQHVGINEAQSALKLVKDYDLTSYAEPKAEAKAEGYDPFYYEDKEDDERRERENAKANDKLAPTPPKEVPAKSTGYEDGACKCDCSLSDEDVERIAVAVIDKLNREGYKSADGEAFDAGIASIDYWYSDTCGPCLTFANQGYPTFPDGILNKIDQRANVAQSQVEGITLLPTFIARDEQGRQLWRGTGVWKYADIVARVRNPQSARVTRYSVQRGLLGKAKRR